METKCIEILLLLCTQVALVVNSWPANLGDTRDMGSIPGWGRCLGGGNGSPLQYSCQENPMDTGGLGSLPGLGRSPGGGNGNPLQYSCLENPMGSQRVRHNWTHAVYPKDFFIKGSLKNHINKFKFSSFIWKFLKSQHNMVVMNAYVFSQVFCWCLHCHLVAFFG